MLVIAAHADDETLGAGGLLTRTANSILLIVPDRIEITKKLYKNVSSLLYPDQTLDQLPIKDLIWEIKQHIVDLKADIVITHSNKESNADHRIVNEAVVVATRDLPINVFGMEVLSSTSYTEPFAPKAFVSLSQRELDHKIHNYKQYATEIKPMRSVDALIGLAQYRGSFVPCQYAEAFEVIKAVI